jgi:hypothetical protein
MHRKWISTALALVVGGVAASASAQTFVSTDVTTNTTWGGAANPSPIILQNAIFVRGGATLTILPGTIVRGQPRTAAVVPGSTVGVPGSLIVTQDGRINATGTPALPIIMTTAATDNNNDGIADTTGGFKQEFEAGDVFYDDTPTTAPLAPLDAAGNGNVALWGGLVILGRAPTNNAEKSGVGYGLAIVEGLTVPGFPAAQATYGGEEPHDNSGVLRYVSIRHAGDEIGNSNELNGLSLGGVGDGTIIENVEVYCNFDDAFEWFGGTVNGKNLHAAFAGDDMYDVDEGYTGVNQFLFGIMPYFNENDAGAFGSASGDKAGEFDGENFRPDAAALFNNVNVRTNYEDTASDPTPWPFSNSSFYNVTVLGSTPDAPADFPAASPASTNRGIQFRNGYAGNVFNSIVVNTGAETGIELDITVTAPCPAPIPAGQCGPGVPGFQAVDNANAGLIALVCSTLKDGAAPAAQETTVINNGNALNLALGGTAAGANSVNAAGFNGLIEEDQTFPLTGNASGKLDGTLKPNRINPRPAAGFVGVVGCTPAAGPSLSPVTFRGAFSAAAGTLWTTGWTALNIGHVLAD